MQVTMVLILIGLSFSCFALTGKQIFQNNCSSCHTNDETFPNVPILHGQAPGYLTKQLQAYQNDTRTDHNLGMMNQIAKNLTDEDIKAVAHYIAGLGPCEVKMTINTQADGFMEKYKAGAKLIAENNCMHCHDKYHHAAPRLYGQKIGYLHFTLNEFKQGVRKNKYMNRILPLLNSEGNIENIATYLNAQRVFRECE